MRKENGITLVALVLTVIVLLILAGVSISLVVGNNGVLTKSSEAVITNRAATAKEQVEIAWASAESDYWTDWAKNSSTAKDADFYQQKLNQYLADTKKEGTEVIVSDKGNGTYAVEYTAKEQGTEYDFLINANGTVTQLSKERKIEIIINGASSSIMSNNATQEQVAVLYGQLINYSAPELFEDRARSNIWRIFYIDTEGKFGNKGAVYLRMDIDTDGTYWKPLSINNITSTAKELKRMAKLNPLWANGANSITLNPSWNNNKAMSYLYDEDVWGRYADPTYAEYAIGGVPVELWAASYNSFIDNTPAIGTAISPSFYKSESAVRI